MFDKEIFLNDAEQIKKQFSLEGMEITNDDMLLLENYARNNISFENILNNLNENIKVITK